MKSQLLPNSFTDKIADPIERKRIVGTPLTSKECFAMSNLKLEREIHNQISNELLRRDIVFYHARTDKKSTIGAGLPDFGFVLRRAAVAIEVKLPGFGLTEEQDKVRVKMESNGWLYFMVHSFRGFLDAIEPY